MTPPTPRLRAEPITPLVEMPSELQPRRLLRRAGVVAAVLLVLVLVVVAAPGLGEVRHILSDGRPGWLVLAVVLEGLSGVSYVMLFRPIFCRHMPWRTSWEIGWSELAMGSIVPASGIGGLALGAWILREGGMATELIARRSVAFFLVKGSVNFVAVAVLGTAMAVGLVGPHESLWLTALPAALAATVIGLVVSIPRIGPGRPASGDAGRIARGLAAGRRTLVDGATEALTIVRARDPLVLVGAVGYWAWDNAVLWATFHAFGYSPPVVVVLMAYLIGQMGGLLPIPGGIGGIDLGLFGTFVAYGTPAAVTAAAVLAYRVILFWLPLVVGGVAFASLRRGLNDPNRPDLCAVPASS
ncbi:MAG: flippase-like domain-containing protein [Thermoleophilaceae bacterium]